MTPSLPERIAELVQETMRNNTDTLVAIYRTDNPNVPINDIVLFMDATKSPELMFRVERRSLLDELLELRAKVTKLELAVMGTEGAKQ
jgi:hypothetical protein